MQRIEALPTSTAAALTEAARRLGIDGCAIALRGPGGRQALWTAGSEPPASAQPVTPQTLFSIGSTGKHFTALAVLELAQAGRLDIAGPLGDVLPDAPAAWAQRSIASLLHHTSGIAEYLAFSEPVPTTRAGFMQAYGDKPQAFAEGDAWSYSNTNYILLGFIAAQCAGESYAAALQHRLLDRTGCAGVAVGGPAWAREVNTQGGTGIADPQDAWREVIGDGDIVMTAHGALAWLGALAATAGDALLSAPWQARMLQPALLNTGRPAPYGCGWFLDHIDGQPCHFHGGHFAGWAALCYALPAAQASVLLLSNHAPGHTRAQRYVSQLALELWLPGSTPLGLRAQPDDDPTLTATARHQLVRNTRAHDPACFADELLRVAQHGDKARPLPNLWAGTEPLAFDFIDGQRHATHTLRRYRLRYVERTEHVTIGTTPEGRIYWAWPL